MSPIKGSTNAMMIGAPFEAATGRLIRGDGVRARLARRYARWHYFSEIQRHVPAGATLLEFGSGGGDAWLAKQYKTLGLELDPGSALASKKTYGTALNADVRSLPLTDVSVDASVSSFVLEHLDPDTTRRALAELYRVLRPGGLFLSLCDLESDHPLLKHARRASVEGYREAFVDVPGHAGLRRENEWRGFLENAGFRIVSWRLLSRFPLLDHCPWCQLAASDHFSPSLRRVGRAAYRLSRMRHVGPLWGFASTLADDIFGPMLPRSWAYRLLFAAYKPETTE